MANETEIKKFIEFFGDKLPNPIQHPKQFAFYVKMYKFLHPPNSDDKSVNVKRD